MRLTYNEFYEQLWGNISDNIVSEEFLNSNPEYIDALTFEMYRMYDMDETLQFTTLRRLTESFFFTLFRLKPI